MSPERNDGNAPKEVDHSQWCEKHGYTKSAPASQGGGSRRRRRGGGTKKGMRRKTGRLAYSKRRGKGGMARVGSRGKGTWRCVVNGRRCTRVRRGGGTKKGMRRKTARRAYSKRH